MFINVYVVNGQMVGADRYFYKLAWLERLRALIQQHYPMSEKVIVAADCAG